MWRDALATKAMAPYLQHNVPGGAAVAAARFAPYEDVLALGTAAGVSTILVPGAGEAAFDSFVAHPWQSARERREAEVAQLLDKLAPELIVLDPSDVAKV